MHSTDKEEEAAIREIKASLQAHRPETAVMHAERFCHSAPACVEAWILLGRARQQCGALVPALEAVQRALELDPVQPGARLLQVELLAQVGRTEEALATLSALTAEVRRDGRILQHIGQLYIHLGRHAEAAQVYGHAVELAPSNPEYLYNLATARLALGELEDAERLLDRVIALAPQDYDAWYNRATLRRQTPQRNHVAELERMLCAPSRHSKSEVPLRFALAKEYEDLGEYTKSFAALKRGADLRRRALSYRVEDDVAVMTALTDTFDASTFADGMPSYGDARPIFILGLPRSGTTLVDRTLSSHGAVTSLGERNDFALALVRLAGSADGKMALIRRSRQVNFAELGASYCAAVVAGQGDTKRLIDKTPLNFLYLGLIALALPNATIIHVRRNAMDVCYAMYKTLFRMAYPFSYDLYDLGRYYLAWHGLMEHWRRVLPGRFIEVDYETLVGDHEGVSRRLIGCCGLEWEDACLAFDRNPSSSLTASAAQARQPIYSSSVGLWKRYADQLAPLAEILRAGGINVEVS
ncbi:MAG: sulfotransferase [Alphaproteobacteria bacterium]|nr:sulfotransferase [Alphaproteobacteria bacterium]